MKNKGFTLVELLAVIVILAIIMIIAIPSVLDTLTIARRKTFAEYIDKIQQAAESKVLSKDLFGESSNCVLFDITSDLGLDNTGDFKGYIVTVHDNSEYKYYITLWDSNFMVYALEYHGDNTDDMLLDYDESKTNELSVDYLAVVSGCSNYTEEKTKETKKANPSEPIPYTGTKTGENGWVAHYTNGVIDECYNIKKEEFCTGVWLPDISSYEPDNHLDFIEVCEEHRSTICCTSNKTEITMENLKYTHYLSDKKSCGWAGVIINGEYKWLFNINAGGGLPESGVYYET